MKYLGITILLVLFFSSCNTRIDIIKRDLVVEKYDLLNYVNLKKPILMNVDDFFDGNNDVASIAPNLSKKPKVSEYYRVFKALLENDKVENVLVNIKDINIYENGKLEDSEWFFTDMIYVIGTITKDEVLEITRHLMPDKVELDNEKEIKKLYPKYSELNVIYIWWD